jgi:hypothetical protein
MTMLRSVSCDEICRRGNVSHADVLALRRAYYEDAKITAAEADALFNINATCRAQDPAWPEFFVEAVTDYIVNCAEPEGYLNAENARWLIDRIGADGRVDSRTELDLVVNVLDKARWAPESLVRFALAQVKHAVVDGDGPLRNGQLLEPGRITEGEIELIRRILFAFAGDGHIAVTRTEAEILFDINDATVHAPENPAWADLFAKAVANCVMASSGYAPPSREEALRREAWLDRRGDLSLGAMLGSIVDRGLTSVIDGYREQSAEERALARLERQRIEIITNEVVTEGEAEWLATRMLRDGELSAPEKALLAFLKRESPKLHPTLQALVDRLDKAA